MDNTSPEGPTDAGQVPVSNHTNNAQAENASKPSVLDNSNSAQMCRFFRRGFCRNGDACRFRHLAPSAAKGAVANTGRSENRVCRFYQRGRCRYGDSCRFRHIKPQAEAQEEEEEEDTEELEEEDDDDYDTEEEDIGWLMQRLGFYGEMSEQEVEEKSRNCGFTEDEVNQLLCQLQGVKPYDSDAEDVLVALQDDWYEHYFGYDYDSIDDNDYDFDWGLGDTDDGEESLNLEKLDLNTSTSSSSSGSGSGSGSGCDFDSGSSSGCDFDSGSSSGSDSDPHVMLIFM